MPAPPPLDPVVVVGVAFWTFVAIAVIGSLWREFAVKREREKTIRALIEKNPQLDPAMLREMLRHQSRMTPEGLLVGGAVTLAGGIGLAAMGFFVSPAEGPSAFYPLLGVGCLAASIGIALLVVGQLMRKRAAEAEAAHEAFERS